MTGPRFPAPLPIADSVAPLFGRVSLAELDARADASARVELTRLYASQGGWGWTVPVGAYKACPAWWGRRRYLAQVDELLTSPAGSAARQGVVSVAACRAVAAGLADSADWATGRNAMPGVDQLAAATGWCRRSVQYALRTLQTLRCVIKVAEGRNWLSRSERLQLWARNSAARSFRAIWALTPPPKMPVDNPELPELRTCTLPKGCKERSSPSFFVVGISSENTSTQSWGQPSSPGLTADTKQEAASPPPAPTKRRRRPWDDGLMALAVDLQRALPGLLAGERPGRLAGCLSRFHKHGWTALDVETEIRRLYERRRKALPHVRPNRPYAWLASVLRELDPTGTPTLDAAMDRYAEQAESEPCSHGMPGGQRVRYRTGTLACPLCRAEHAASVRLAEQQ